MVNILDCTLRDGGYVNNWNFTLESIELILKKLVDSRVEIIECGFLKEKITYDKEKTLFDTIERFEEVIPKDRGKSKFVCMVNYGDYEVDHIPENNGKSVDGIRIVFHKKDLEDTMIFAEKLSKKGYMIFIQPMVTIKYTDKELLALIEKVNKINPYAFYIVDSFGVMKKNDLIRMSYLVDNNLNEGICLGYHSHNNLQLSYSNSQNFLEVATNRIKIVDSSIYGMGRGAGNLNTELFLEYLNENYGKKYLIDPLLDVIDEVLEKVYLEKKWGYSLPYYLSAVCNCHPNYGLYLEKLGTLTVKSMNEILSQIDELKKDSFDKDYIHKLYIDHQNHNFDDKEFYKKLKNEIENKEILLLAPGKSLDKEKEMIEKFIKEKSPIVISINFTSEYFKSDSVFISNEKRYQPLNGKENIIVTSNILEAKNKNIMVFNYLELLVDNVKIRDNSALMLINLLKKIGIKDLNFAGFDGYSFDNKENYLNENLMIHKSTTQINELNYAISEELHRISKEIKLNFITKSRYTTLISYQNQ